LVSESKLQVTAYSGSFFAETILQLLPTMINLLLFLFCSFIIVFEMDFVNFGLGLFFPRKTFLLRFVFFSIRVLYFYVICKIVFVFSIFLLQLLVFECYLGSGVMHEILNRTKFKVIVLMENNSGRVFSKRCNNKRLNDLLDIHTCLRIAETIANKVYSLFIPQGLLLVGLTLIFANYGAIRMHSVIPMPYYLGFPVLAAFLILMIVLLLPLCSKMHENSGAFLDNMRKFFSGSKYYLRKVKSQRRFRLEVGGMFCVKKSTQTTFYLTIFDYTINLLLLY